ncbi:MAG: DUF4197 domain-containing protein [Pseudomonadota bacterium]
MNRSSLIGIAILLLAPAVGYTAGATPAGPSPSETSRGLKAALTQAVQVAVDNLGRKDGFLGNPEVRIPLPGKLEKAQGMLKILGLNSQTDALVTAMNRAAEAAVPEARVLLVDAVKQMSIQDAAAILTGAPDAATQYFRRKTSGKLTERLQPLVGKATQQVQLAKRYDDVAGKASQLGLIDAKDANLDGYVTRKALDGLFLMMAREEQAIRKDPLGQASSLLRQVFSTGGAAP